MKRINFLILLALVAACTADREIEVVDPLGPVVVEAVDTIDVSTTVIDDSYDELVAVVEREGAFGEWRAPTETPSITPASGRGPIVQLDWSQFDDRPVQRGESLSTIEGIEFFGVCDDSCERRLSAEAVRIIQDDPQLPTIRTSVCPSCANVQKRSILEVDGDTLVGLSTVEVFDAFAPIDTDHEVTLLFDDVQYVMNTPDGWRVITVFYADRYCTPTDRSFRLWSLDSDGERTQLAIFDVPAGDEQMSCA